MTSAIEWIQVRNEDETTAVYEVDLKFGDDIMRVYIPIDTMLMLAKHTLILFSHPGAHRVVIDRCKQHPLRELLTSNIRLRNP